MCYTILSAQEAKVKISGKIQDRSREPIEVATIYLQGSKISCVSGQKGEYTLEVSPGTYTLVCSSLGFETFTERITVSAGDDVKKNIILKSVSKDLDEVIVFGKSQVKEVKESAYNVAALDAKPFYNTTMDISNALDRMSGVKIRLIM
ncbi:hypothetical protein QE152_g41276 [Popillia japonica]|uniref:TonB-dependent receptor n=1 Tax=Popillia japonica TaxID=7064 RepID=A0AAW1GV33_POPJA